MLAVAGVAPDSLLRGRDKETTRSHATMTAMARSKAIPIPEVPAKVVWVEVKAPGLDEIKRAPIGTAYTFKERPGMYHVRAKASKDNWLQVCERTVAKAVAEWRSYTVTRPKGTGHFTSDGEIDRCLNGSPWSPASTEIKRLER
jgi:hypothetical protein